MFVIADISGHGVDATLGTATLKATLYSSINPIRYNLQTSVNTLVKKLEHTFTYEQYLTLIIGEVDILSKKLKYYSFGHFPGIHYNKRSKKITLIEANQSPIGLSEIQNIKRSVVQFDRGDKFLFLTNGVFESYNKREEMYGLERILFAIKNCKTENILPKIQKDVKKFVGTQPFDDDITMLQFNIL